MSKWSTISCEDCGCEIYIHEDWDNPPSICKSCKEERANKWYETTCKGCGGSIWANRDWDSLPSFVKTVRVQMLQRMSPATVAERASLFQSARKLNANKVVGSCQENVLTVASYLGTSHSIQYKKRLFLVTLSIVHTIALAN